MVTGNTQVTLYSVPPMQSPEQAPLPFPSSLTSCLPLSCPSCRPWWPGRPGSPLHFEWLHCWDPHLGGSLEHSEGTRGPASHRNHPPPLSPWLAQMCPWLSWHQCLLIPPDQTLRKRGQSGHLHGISNLPVRPNSCWLMVIFSRIPPLSPSVPVVAIPASAAEAAAARRASSSCRCRCSSIDTRRAWPARDPHWDLLQIQSHWHRDPAWHHLHQPKSEN
uniref:Uncharacterized protein n=1 Tax=Callithrix jacchus TaxID=9483 RepID=F6VCY1_CALJA